MAGPDDRRCDPVGAGAAANLDSKARGWDEGLTMGVPISITEAKARYWQLQRQSDLAQAVLKDLIRSAVDAGGDIQRIAGEVSLTAQFVKDAVTERPHDDEAFTFALPDGSYVRRWFSTDTDAMTWYAARALPIGFDREIGPFPTMDAAVAALE